MRAILIIIATSSLPILLYAQHERSIRYTIGTGFGFTLPIQKTQTGAITDHLVGNKATMSYYFQLSSNYFFTHWGFGGTIVLNESTNPQNFVIDVQKKYANNYYVNIYGFDKGVVLTTQKILIGPAYKIEQGKLVFIYKLQLGVSQFSRWTHSAYLKEKNTNTIIAMDWTTNNSDKNFLCLNPSFSFGYKVKDKLLINVEVNSDVTFSKFTYSEKSRDIYSNISATKLYNYNKFINEISVGLSAVFILTTYKKAQ
jgi:hypothetical protein